MTGRGRLDAGRGARPRPAALGLNLGRGTHRNVMPYHMPFRSGSHPLAFEPDEAALRARHEGLQTTMRRQQRLKDGEQPTPPPSLRVSLRAAAALPPLADGTQGEVRMQPDGAARLVYDSSLPSVLPHQLFQGTTFAVLIDTHSTLGPVCAAALQRGAPSVRAFRSGGDILELKSSPQPALMGPRLWGGSRTDTALLEDEETIVGGIMFEAESAREIRALEAAAAQAAEDVEEAKVAGLNTTLRNPLEQRNTEIHTGPLRRAEKRLASIAGQLRGAQIAAAGPAADTHGDLDDVAVFGAERGELAHRRAIESAMAEAWKGTSVLEYEQLPQDSSGHVFYSCGRDLWETVAALAAAAEDPADQYAHGPQRVCLGGPMVLSALREEIVEWWAGAVRRGQTEINLVVLSNTDALSSAADELAVSGLGERGGGAGAIDLRATPGADDSAAGAAVPLPSADELVSAILLFQLMQCVEVEIAEEDSTTRELLRTVVRAAADGPAGWSRIDTALRSAVLREREQQRKESKEKNAEEGGGAEEASDLTGEQLTALLHFDRHSVVPLLHDPEADYMGQGLMEAPAWTRERHEFRESDLRL
eukprot:COSAG06_NODE_302_length_17869_cov_90.137535_6_plen_591_part_00